MTNWQTKRLGDVIELRNTKFNPQFDGSMPDIEMESIFSNTGLLGEIFDSKYQLSIKTRFSKGDVLFGKLRPYLRKFAIAPFDGVCSTEIWVLNGKIVSNKYLFYMVQTGDFERASNIQSGSKMPRSDWKTVASTSSLIPEKPEQQRIVSVLEVWDEYIEKLEQKIALKEQLKKGLMQQLLTGKRRLPGFDSRWTTLEFKDVFKVLSKYPGYKSSEYLSSGKYPIFDQSYDKLISGYTDENNKIINPKQPLILFGDHSRVVKYITSEYFAVGNDGIKLFETQNHVDNYYAYMLLKSHRIPNTGYNRHFKYISDAIFDIPNYDEQLCISSIVMTADKEIDALADKVQMVKLQKKYLLQNLITGKIRTPEDLQSLEREASL